MERGYWTEAQAANVRLADEELSTATAYPEDPEDYEDDEDDDDQGDEFDGETPDGAQGGGEEPVWRPRFAAAYVCTEHSTYGHQPVYTGLDYGRRSSNPTPASEAEAEAQKAAASAERKRVIEHNRNWTSAEKVRRTFLTALVRRKTAPKGAAAFVARSLIEGNHAVRRAMEGQHTGLADLLGPPFGAGATSTTLSQPRPVTLLDGASDARAQVLTLAVILAAYEAATGKHSWRNVDGGTTRYLRFLADNGYDLAEVEWLACGEPAPHSRGTATTQDSETTADEDSPEPNESAVA